MSLNSIGCVLYATLIALSLIYLPQPLTPLLGDYFHLKAHSASSIVSLTLLPLAIAPVIYGYFLEKFSAKKILVFSMLACGFLQLLSAFSKEFYIFLSLRILQSVFFPAILTTSLTILTRMHSQNVQKNSSLYVSATITGGLIGRVAGSWLADIFSWQVSFDIFGFLMILGGFWALGLKKTAENGASKITIKEMLPFLKDKRYLWILLGVFVMFFSFQSMLSVLPFFLVHTDDTITSTQIGFIYVGYLIGIVVSLFANKTTQILHSKSNAISFGLAIFGVGVLIMLKDNLFILLLGMLVMCAGSFTSHSILSALINSISKSDKGIINGLYLTFYYTGGVFGSFLPLVFYDKLGWSFTCLVIAMLLFTNSFLVFRHKKLYSKE